MTQYETKDSGERARFDSGMQRDTEDGKPRFDLLLPLGVPYEDQFLTRVAALLGRGAVKYEQRNWEQANSEAELARMRSSAYRHFMQWITGEGDEDHAAAVVFNLLAHETTAYKMALRATFEEVDEDSSTLETGEEPFEADEPTFERLRELMHDYPIWDAPKLIERAITATDALARAIPPIGRIFIADQEFGTYEDDDEGTRAIQDRINAIYNQTPRENLRF